MVKWADVTEESYEKLDDLFKEVRLSIATVRKNDPETGNKLKGLIRQIELWVDSLVLDSIKLRNLETELQRRKELAKILLKSLNTEQKTRPDMVQPTKGE